MFGTKWYARSFPIQVNEAVAYAGRLERADRAAWCMAIGEMVHGGRNTVTRTLARAQENGLTWEKARTMSQEEVSLKLFPADTGVLTYKMPDYEHVHKEMQKSGVTLTLLWVEYCEQCRKNGCIFRRHLNSESGGFEHQNGNT